MVMAAMVKMVTPVHVLQLKNKKQAPLLAASLGLPALSPSPAELTVLS